MHILRNKRLIISFYNLPKNFTILRWETNNVIMMHQREIRIKPWFGKRAHTRKRGSVLWLPVGLNSTTIFLWSHEHTVETIAKFKRKVFIVHKIASTCLRIYAFVNIKRSVWYSVCNYSNIFLPLIRCFSSKYYIVGEFFAE